MKLEIELDLNKIDYDAINAQIQEKIKELNIKEIYEIEARVRSKVDERINDDISYVFNEYIQNYWRQPTDKGRRLIDTVVNNIVREKVSELVDEIFDTIGEDVIKEYIIKQLPVQLADILTAKLLGSIEMSGYEMMDKIRMTCREETEAMINSRLHQLMY